MQSNLTILEFRNKFNSCTKVGNPKFKFFTVFCLFTNDYSKPFYGLIDDSTFSVTSNLKVVQSLFTIRGNYKKVNNTLQIQYTIFPKFKYLYHFWIFCFALFLGGVGYINYTFIQSGRGNDLNGIDTLCGIMMLIATLNLALAKRNLKRKFIKVFEISS